MRVNIAANEERWALKVPFMISRGPMTDAPLLIVEVGDGECTGRGESCPAPHFGEDVASALRQIEALDRSIDAETDLATLLPSGSARNALDCALWDYRAKRAGKRVWELMGRPAPGPLETVLTLGLAAPEAMAAAAKASGHSILKLKLGGEGDLERVAAVRGAVPGKRIIVDVNEGWSPERLAEAMPELHRHGVELIEQPLPDGQDEALRDIEHLVPIGADESCHTADDLDRVAGLYDAVNIKLDKTGGLSEALRLLDAARARGLKPMVGCMLGTSLAMAPALLVGQEAVWVDLDAPLLVGADRAAGLLYRDGLVHPPTPQLWG
jgi:L-alanine-DL-glutamate epimerase-like enolase superfamily enzyme